MYPLICLAGFLAGGINTLAGSGSLVSLAMLSLVGLSSPVANGTNRLGVLIQSFIATLTVQRSSQAIDWRPNTSLILVTVLGAIVGSRIAVAVNEDMLDLVLGLLMIIMFVIIVWNPGGGLLREESLQKNKWYLLPIFFAIGLYGGFIQAGVGVFMLMALVLVAGKNLIQANAIKMVIVLIYTIPVLAVFIFYDQVNWWYAIWLSIGQALGAFLSAKFLTQHAQAKFWIRRLLLVIVFLSGLRFLWKFLN